MGHAGAGVSGDAALLARATGSALEGLAEVTGADPAADLLAVARSSLPGAVRPVLFAAPLEPAATAAGEDRPVAFLGRRPAAVPAARGQQTVSS